MAILNSARVNKNAIQRQSFANLYNLINNRTNVPDPADGSGIRKFVFVRLPRIGRGFNGFPFIVINRMKPTKGKSTASLTKSFMSYDTTLTIYTQDEDSDNQGNANGAEQNNLISDNVIKTLNDSTNRKTLIDQRMANLEYNIDTDEDEFEGRRVFTSEFDIRFEETLLTIS